MYNMYNIYICMYVCMCIYIYIYIYIYIHAQTFGLCFMRVQPYKRDVAHATRIPDRSIWTATWKGIVINVLLRHFSMP